MNPIFETKPANLSLCSLCPLSRTVESRILHTAGLLGSYNKDAEHEKIEDVLCCDSMNVEAVL